MSPLASSKSVSAFLALAKAAASSGVLPAPYKHATFVMGNQSADLDSIVSAISYAFLCHSRAPTPPPTLHIPVINIPRRDFALRPDCLHLLSHAFPPSPSPVLPSLVFADDLDLLLDAAEKDTRSSKTPSVALTDHNRLTHARLTTLGARVVAVLDHHADEGAHRGTAAPRVVEAVGSATSLVAREWERAATAASSLPPPPASLCWMMLGAIAVDTVNLGEVGVAAGRVTDVDVAAVEFLERQIAAAEAEESAAEEVDGQSTVALASSIRARRDALFEALGRAKGDCAGMSSEDLLRKDYKETVVEVSSGGTVRLGISSVPWRLGGGTGRWISREGGALGAVRATVSGFAAARGLDVVVVMTARTDVADGAFRRELAVFTRAGFAAAAGEALVRAVESEAYGLQLGERVEDGGGSGGGADGERLVVWFVQGNLKESRKLLQPKLIRTLAEGGGAAPAPSAAL
ncbi:hypothetical protein DFJ73DRAFT_656261 [Zopfochytrium polystomum]|nr:hypothetical protein DFJ73DRAFT_656261 [Zopfochytrium polystomum]